MADFVLFHNAPVGDSRVRSYLVFDEANAAAAAAAAGVSLDSGWEAVDMSTLSDPVPVEGLVLVSGARKSGGQIVQ